MSSAPLHKGHCCPACGQPTSSSRRSVSAHDREGRRPRSRHGTSVEVSEILGMRTAAAHRQASPARELALLPPPATPLTARDRPGAPPPPHDRALRPRQARRPARRGPASRARRVVAQTHRQQPAANARRNKGSVRCPSPILPICCALSSAGSKTPRKISTAPRRTRRKSTPRPKAPASTPRSSQAHRPA